MAIGLLANPVAVTSGAQQNIRIAENVAQTAHGFSVGQVVYKSGSSYALAEADAAATTYPCGIVESVPSANSFVLVRQGPITLSGLTAGAIAYLSDTVPGGYTFTKPTATTSYEVPLFFAASTTQAEVNIDTPEVLSGVANADMATMSANTVKGNPLEIDGLPQDIPFSQLVAEAAPGATDGQVLTWNQAEGKYLPEDPSASISTGFSPISMGSGTNIDFSEIPHLAELEKTLTGNLTLTVSNLSANIGKRIRFTVNNPSTHTITFPGSAVAADAGTIPQPSTGNKVTQYELVVRTAAMVVFSRLIYGISSDTTAPTVVSATIPSDGLTTTITYSEATDFGTDAYTNFTFAASAGGALTATYLSGRGTDTHVLTNSRAVLSGQTITRSYTASAQGIVDLAGNQLGNFTTQSVTNNSTATSYLHYEDFEDAPPAAFTGTGTYSFSSTTSPIEGAQSASVGNGSVFTGTITIDLGTGYSELWVRMRYRIGAYGSNDWLEFANTSNTKIAGLAFQSGGSRFLASHGTATVSNTNGGVSPTINANGVLWVRYVSGSGSNGVLELYQADNTSSLTRPTTSGTGTRVSTISTGTATTGVRYIKIQTPGAGINYIDKVLIQQSEITSSTP